MAPHCVQPAGEHYSPVPVLGRLHCPISRTYSPCPCPKTDRRGQGTFVVEKNVYVHLVWVSAIPYPGGYCVRKQNPHRTPPSLSIPPGPRP